MVVVGGSVGCGGGANDHGAVVVTNNDGGAVGGMWNRVFVVNYFSECDQ